MSDAIATLATMAASAVGGGVGAWLALRDRVQALEHEVWGVKGTNGLKGYTAELSQRIDAVLSEERTNHAAVNRRNARQHPAQERT